MRKLRLHLLLASLAVLAAPPAAWADALDSGLWDSPYGKVKFERDGDKLVGKLTESSRVCSFAKGEDVLRGQVDEDVFTGEARVCYPGKCAEPEWVLALALSSKAPARWLGGVLEPTTRGCAANPKGAFKLERPKAAPVVTQPSAPSVRFRSRDAEQLVNDALNARMEMDVRGALRLLKAAETKEPEHPYILELMADMYRQQKEYDQARRYFQRLAKKDVVGGNYNLACFEAQYGNRDAAMGYLTRSVAEGWYQVDAAVKDPDLAPLRTMPTWDGLVAKMQKNAEKRAQKR